MLPPAERHEPHGGRGAALWAAAVALLLLVPLPAPPAVPPALAGLPWDKLAHAVLFFTLGRAWQRWWRRRRPASAGGAAARLAVALAATAYGGLLELVQGALGAGRAAEWGDVAADALGALIVALAGGRL